jgi:hypothetical protein
MSVALELVGGKSALLVAIEGEVATVDTDAASPPGATLELLVLGAPARLKVRRCRRLPEAVDNPRFRIEGRWLSLSRAQRAHLLG